MTPLRRKYAALSTKHSPASARSPSGTSASCALPSSSPSCTYCTNSRSPGREFVKFVSLSTPTPTTDPPQRPSRVPTRPAHTTIGWRQDRRPVVSKQPPHSRSAAKMSQHICIGPEAVLAVHARSPTASGSHCQAGTYSAPHLEQNFCTVTCKKDGGRGRGVGGGRGIGYLRSARTFSDPVHLFWYQDFSGAGPHFFGSGSFCNTQIVQVLFTEYLLHELKVPAKFVKFVLSICTGVF
jgi:hypothetical protein